MTMLSYTDLTKGTLFVMDGEPYVVLEYAFLRMQQRKPVVQTKLRNVKTGKIVQKSFQPSDSFLEAEIEKQPITFLYANRGENWFCEKGNPKARFSLSDETLGDSTKYLLPNTEVNAFKFGDEIINIELPVKIEYKVKEAPPSFKGDTATGGNKSVTLENGLVLNVPGFVNEGDIIRVNTETGQYTERAEKK
jgi:elongation factor P